MNICMISYMEVALSAGTSVRCSLSRSKRAGKIVFHLLFCDLLPSDTTSLLDDTQLSSAL